MNTKIAAFFLLAAATLTSCNQDKLDQLEGKYKELSAHNQETDSLINDFVGSFNAFEDNLEQIKDKENMIAFATEDGNMDQSVRERVVEDIQMVNSLLAENQQLIEELTAQSEANQGKVNDYQRLLNRLKKQLADRGNEIASLKENLLTLNFEEESLNADIDSLFVLNTELTTSTETQAEMIIEQDAQIESQTEVIAQQRAKITEGYYVVGDAKSLKSANVIASKTSGTLEDGFDKGVFTSVNIEELSALPINSKKAQLMTPHPSSSYQWVEEDNQIAKLEILDPAKFWRSTKYLVVSTR
ncbi:hypothetical protein [Pontibacter sp. G13]|uniref:Cbp1 family collagen-binding glycoprotein adhesin n=1 Tax=Pontibacter sp. G13 TaxID=3074898 RepID=UPI0028894CC5|nr:hypothetical protein [Pontibacter sp. G13]WNJ19973.1 hypothetical protein RJD25_05775 [Pontibacter sp. G13]